MLKLYPEQHQTFQSYRNVFEKLKILPAKDHELLIVLIEYPCDPNFETDRKTYVDVFGRKKEKDPNDITDGYALEFVEWKEWLGM